MRSNPIKHRSVERGEGRRGARPIAGLWWLLSVLALVAAAVVAWWAAGQPLPRYRGANVLLVTIDTLRADRLGSYGYERAETPRLDALATEGIRFQEVVAPAPLTLPSHTSLMTSMRPPSHGVRDNGAFEISSEAETLAETFQRAGYETAAFVGAYVLHSRWGLARGFETYDEDFDYGKLREIQRRTERRGGLVVQAALDWLERERDTSFFAWVHLYDPHDPYEAPEPYGSRFAEEPYDGEVAYSDFQVGRLLDGLAERGVAEETVVIVTSDHGEALEEHGEYTHGFFLYDPTVLVPLIFRLPDRKAVGRQVADQVRLIDVPPTILELVELPRPASFEGESLLPFLTGQGSARPAYSETLLPRWHFGWQELHALRRDGYKYVLAPRPELYLLAADPGETENLAEVEPARAAGMRAAIEELRGQESVGPGKLSREEMRKLRALGYIGAPATHLPEGPLADPKDKIHIFRRVTEAQGMTDADEPALAAQLAEAVITEDPLIVQAHLVLGEARMKLEDYAGAAEAFERATELNPELALALFKLGRAKMAMGERHAARATLEAVLQMDPLDLGAHFQLGEMDLEEQSPQAALRHFEAGLTSHEDVPDLQFGIGVASMQLGDVERAAGALQRCAEVAPRYPQVHYYLALVAEARGNRLKAVEEYRAEVETTPEHYESWFNLSVLLFEEGSLEAASEALRKAIVAKPDLAVAHLYLGRALLAQGDPRHYEEAARAVERGLTLSPPPDLRQLGRYILLELEQARRRSQSP